MLPFLKLVRYSPAMRSLLAALHAERRTLFGCVVILTGAVLLFASLLYAIEHNVQPDKFGTIPQAMWWAIVTLGTVGYGDVVPVTPLGKMVVGVRHHRRLRDDRAAGGDHRHAPLPMRCAGAISSSPGACWRGCRCSRISAPPRSPTSCGCCARRPSRPARSWCGAAMPASSMYFITAGEVEIELPNQRVRLADGTFFGEIALLHRTKRSGTVTATRKTKLLALDAQDFHALIERMPALAAHVKETAEARLADTAEALKGDIAAGEIGAGRARGQTRDIARWVRRRIQGCARYRPH